ncbi:MmgE/PrpD family protein [Candidimonas nitroreducens]|uniref:2-methylcitrate dehydratase n=1 Tax=Candidimonas nitroreducens TaxID=683354 RepID=A0A225MER6_9BURK|nr:MmgE/PrpD family protein [Candidimonas nitroreducens]OWT57449.1 2-methylcitrate dehydratase [Candidimonas nitroreducens]
MRPTLDNRTHEAGTLDAGPQGQGEPRRGTIVDRLAEFTTQTRYESLPGAVIDECKRIILDSLGCALAGVDAPKGRIGIAHGLQMGGATPAATVIGTGDRTSIAGASFANAELINALDFDGVLPPGHVTPFVLPGALAVAESLGATGREFIASMAVAHEMSYRFGKAMDNLRAVKDGKVSPPSVFGYSSAIFGATAAITQLKRLPTDVVAHALGIAACISPVNSQAAWFQHAPSATIKYSLAGTLAQSALTAASMGELGHRGDSRILDDREFGYARYIGTSRWEPAAITNDLGEEWRFPPDQVFKPYPHCRIFHTLLDTLAEIVAENALKPEEIDDIEAWVEGFVDRPVWLNRRIEHPSDAQFSLAHGLAVGAHGIPPGKAWQDPEVVFSPSVLGLMGKVRHRPHPDYVELLAKYPASRPARIAVSARGKVFVNERLYPKGSNSPDPGSAMTTQELALKFQDNARGVLPPENAQGIIDTVLHLETVEDINVLTALLRKG